MRAISLKLPDDLDKALTRIARKRHSSRSQVLREALESYTRGASEGSVTAAAGDLVGSLSGPRDLSTNPKYLAGYGE
jgi:predicted transcriptional regulator